MTVSGTERRGSPSVTADGPLQAWAPKRIPANVDSEATPAGVRNAATIEIDARIVAEGLGIAPQEVEPARQAGTITTLCERGTGEDAGWVRATFYYGKRRLRLLVDAEGQVLQQPPGPDQPNT